LFGRPAPLSEPAPTTAGVPQQRRTDAGERSGAINPW
jgi:hypothetical protein